MNKFIFVLLFCFFGWCVACSGDMPKIDSLQRDYTRIEKKCNLESIKPDTNYNFTGNYAWGLSYFLMAKLIVFEKTRDEKELTSFIQLAHILLSRMDHGIGLRDWNNIIGYGWSSRRRWDPTQKKNVNNGLPMRDLVEDAMITYPLLRFSEVVSSDSSALRNYVQTAREFASSAEMVMEEHIREQWDGAGGHFYFPKNSPIWSDGVNVPHNYEAQAGRCLLLLYRVTKKEEYIQIVRTLASNFKKDLTAKGKNYVWYYWGGKGYRGWSTGEGVSTHTPSHSGSTSVEDVGHGGLDIHFMIDCYYANIVFDKNDIDMLTNTFTAVIDKQTYLADNVIGAGDSKSRGAPVFYWIRFAEFRPSVYNTFFDIFYKDKVLDSTYGNAYLVANLIKYFPDNSR